MKKDQIHCYGYFHHCIMLRGCLRYNLVWTYIFKIGLLCYDMLFYTSAVFRIWRHTFLQKNQSGDVLHEKWTADSDSAMNFVQNWKFRLKNLKYFSYNGPLSKGYLYRKSYTTLEQSASVTSSHEIEISVTSKIWKILTCGFLQKFIFFDGLITHHIKFKISRMSFWSSVAL